MGALEILFIIIIIIIINCVHVYTGAIFFLKSVVHILKVVSRCGVGSVQFPNSAFRRSLQKQWFMDTVFHS